MLLNALWGGHCAPMTHGSHDFTKFLQCLCFPKLFLSRNDVRPGQVAAYLDDSEVALGVALGDAISCELSLTVPAGAMIFVMGQPGPGAKAMAEVEALEVMAVALQAGIAHSDVPLPISLCVWAFISLTEAMRSESTHPQRLSFAALERVMGYPSGRASMSFEAYLRCLEPEFVLPLPDCGLANRMRSAASFEDWLAQLQVAFSLALEPDLARQ